MKIESSEVKIEAETNYVFEQKQSSEFTSQLINAKLDLKDEIRKENFVIQEVSKLERVLLSEQRNLSHQDKIKKSMLEILLQNFTKDKDFKLQPTDGEIKETSKMQKQRELFVQIEETNFKLTREVHQKSSIEFNTQAFVKTNRGQINIALDISFSQEFYEKHETQIRSRKEIWMDPLIINYEGNLTSFDNISSSMKFEFDLNSNGANELIPTLKDGAGFLALDKSKDGIINNGNELFGANTGDGFQELREYDKDGNSWIDENDTIFNDLLIWERNENGEDSLITLGQAGIGAIYLSATDSVFTYSSGVREEYAKLKESSFYLKENGEAGLVTSVDFATEKIV